MKEITSCKLVLITGELFDIAVNEFGAKKSTCCNRVFILIEGPSVPISFLS